MSVGSDTADQLVREGIQVTESALKLAGLGAKNLAAIIMALCNEPQHLKGKTSLGKMLQDNRSLKIVRIKTDDLKEFGSECKSFGAPYTAIKDKNSKEGLCDVLVRAEDISQINRIMERMGYVSAKAEKGKNGQNPEVSGKNSGRHSLYSQAPAMMTSDGNRQDGKLAGLKSAAQNAKNRSKQNKGIDR